MNARAKTQSRKGKALSIRITRGPCSERNFAVLAAWREKFLREI